MPMSVALDAPNLSRESGGEDAEKEIERCERPPIEKCTGAGSHGALEVSSGFVLLQGSRGKVFCCK